MRRPTQPGPRVERRGDPSYSNRPTDPMMPCEAARRRMKMVHQHQFDIVVTTRIALPLWMKRRMHRQNGARCTRPMLVGERKIEDSYLIVVGVGIRR